MACTCCCTIVAIEVEFIFPCHPKSFETKFARHRLYICCINRPCVVEHGAYVRGFSKPKTCFSFSEFQVILSLAFSTLNEANG